MPRWALLSALRGVTVKKARPTLASDYQSRHDLFLKLLALPGATAPTVLDDVRWAWDADPAEPLFIDRLAAIQLLGVYPDRQARLVRFNAALVIKAFPSLRGQFADIQTLRPMRFDGTLPNRPPAKLHLVQTSS
jgi:hypothetical protein